MFVRALALAALLVPLAATAEEAADKKPETRMALTGDFVDLGSMLLDEEPVVRDTRMRIEEEEPTDTAIALTSALVITTFVLLILAHIVAQNALADLFGKGLLA